MRDFWLSITIDYVRRFTPTHVWMWSSCFWLCKSYLLGNLVLHTMASLWRVVRRAFLQRTETVLAISSATLPETSEKICDSLKSNVGLIMCLSAPVGPGTLCHVIWFVNNFALVYAQLTSIYRCFWSVWRNSIVSRSCGFVIQTWLIYGLIDSVLTYRGLSKVLLDQLS